MKIATKKKTKQKKLSLSDKRVEKKKKKLVSKFKNTDDDEAPSSTSGWAVTDPSKFRALSQQAQTENRRAPEVWVRDGESRLLRFVDTDAIVCLAVYKFRVNGRWSKFIKPPEDKPDLFATALGLRPTRIFLYRVIDINGYTNRQNKKLRNVPRFLAATTRQYDQLSQLSKELEMGLNKFDIKISRSGSGTNTTYMFIPKQASPMSIEMKKAIASFPKWESFYAPLSTSQQRSLIASVGATTESEDEDED